MSKNKKSFWYKINIFRRYQDHKKDQALYRERVKITQNVNLASGTKIAIPLRTAILCINCDFIADINTLPPICPRCGSIQMIPVREFFKEREPEFCLA